MFDINGGDRNVFTFLLWSISFFIFVIAPTVAILFGHEMKWYKRYYPFIVFVMGFAFWFSILYVANPSLSFWK